MLGDGLATWSDYGSTVVNTWSELYNERTEVSHTQGRYLDEKSTKQSRTNNQNTKDLQYPKDKLENIVDILRASF